MDSESSAGSDPVPAEDPLGRLDRESPSGYSKSCSV